MEWEFPMVDKNSLANPSRDCQLEMMVAYKGGYQLRPSKGHVDFYPPYSIEL